MFDKLSFIEQQHEELAKKISDPSVMADMSNWQKLCKEHSDMTPIVEKYKEYKANKATIDIFLVHCLTISSGISL